MGKKIHNSLTAIIAMVVFGMPSTANAVSIFSQEPIISDGLRSSLGQWIADDFTLGGLSTITDVVWRGGYNLGNSPGIENFSIGVYSDLNGGGIGQLLASFDVGAGSRVDTGQDLSIAGFSNDVFEYSASLSGGLSLAAGTYWLSIIQTAAGQPDWFWSGDLSGGLAGFSSNSGGSWFPTTGTMYFSLNGSPTTVPEPGALALLGFGYLGIALARRRKRTV